MNEISPGTPKHARVTNKQDMQSEPYKTFSILHTRLKVRNADCGQRSRRINDAF